MSEFKYVGCVLDESGTDETKRCRKVTGGRKVVDAIRSLVRSLSVLGSCKSHCSCLLYMVVRQ